MTNEDYSKVPPPHLLKKFSEQAREDSQKRGHPGYCKTFAKLCIDWAFREAAMDDLRVASAEVSGVELNSKSVPNNLQIRSSDLDVTIALVQQWTDEIYGGPGAVVGADRRPKPPSLKEQALETLKYPKDFWSEAEVDTIRLALEQLDD